MRSVPANRPGTTRLRKREYWDYWDQAPPKGYSQWNGRLLAEALPDISKDQVWRILRRHDICLERRRSWCIRTDPEFGPKAADMVGLYLNPPENALALAVDEKPPFKRWNERRDTFACRMEKP